MDRRSYPLWLLRDWPAFIGFLLSFWSLMFASFIAERRRMRGRQLSQRDFESLAQSFAIAESKLDHAIWRQAWRACGYSHHEATFTLFATPTTGEDLCRRYLAYTDALRHMEELVIAYADDLRQRFNLSRADIGDPNAWVDPLRRAPRATSPSIAGGGRPPATRTVSSTADRRGRWRAASSRRDGGGLPQRAQTHARGPPMHTSMIENPSRLPSATRDWERAPLSVHGRTTFPPHRGTRAPHYACATVGTCISGAALHL